MASHEQLLTAVQRATRKLASLGDFDALLKDVLAICVEAADASGGTIYLHDKANRKLKFQHVLPEDVSGKLKSLELPDDYGVVGRVYQTRRADISEFDPEDEERKKIDAQIGVQIRNMITVPLMLENDDPIGVVQLLNKRHGSFNENDIAVLDTVSAVSTLAYLNSRLLEEQTRSSQLLGMGKVGHDIKNMAAAESAILYVFEPSLETLEEHLSASKDALGLTYAQDIRDLVKDLRENNERILGFTTLISDLSVGKELTPNKKMGNLGESIDNSASYLASEARRKGVSLRAEIQGDAPEFDHDPIYMQRIVQNLVGNAIKAVLEATPPDVQERVMRANGDAPSLGEVVVRYKYCDGDHILEVQDSGPGMPAEIVQRILSGQGKSGWSSSGGSGWGTKIVLELSATHSGALTIDSEPGHGTTFRVTFGSAE